MAEIVERSINTGLLAFPLGVWFCRKIERDLPNRFREGHSQLAARVVITEQHISDRRAALHAGKPGFEYSRHILVYPVDTYRPAIDEDDDHRFADRINCLHQIQLVAWQIETGARGAFTDGFS